jgi:hypothetical protein
LLFSPEKKKKNTNLSQEHTYEHLTHNLFKLYPFTNKNPMTNPSPMKDLPAIHIIGQNHCHFRNVGMLPSSSSDRFCNKYLSTASIGGWVMLADLD